MTIQEAFEIIKDEIPYESGVINEALKMVEGAVGKQMPRKPKNYLVNMKHIDFLCPNCKKKIISKVDGEWVAGKKQQHCDNCGQAFRWE